MEQEAFKNLLSRRQSDRKFDPTRAVAPEIVSDIIEMARLTPSACNAQPWEVVAVTDPEISQKVGREALKGIVGMNKFILDAPVHILIIAGRKNLTSGIGSKLRNLDFVPFDIGIYTGFLSLAASSYGLGSCIIGMLNGDAVAKELGIPRDKRIVFDIVLGYSLEKTREKKRKETSTYVHFNKW